jgi:hypothetical protein
LVSNQLIPIAVSLTVNSCQGHHKGVRQLMVPKF